MIFKMNTLKYFKDKWKTYLNSSTQYTTVWDSDPKVIQHNSMLLKDIFQTFTMSTLMSPRAPLEKQALANELPGWAKTAIAFWLHQGLTSVVLLSETDVKQRSNVL